MGNLIKYKKLMLMLSILHWKQLLAFFPTQIRPSIHSVPLRCIATTQYTIEEVGVDPKVLEKTILKHCQNLDLFLESKPIAAHTQEAFSALQDALAIVKQAPIILDSGCGTGKSTETLGKLYPEHTIIGVDRSLARLTKNGVYRQQTANDGGTMGNVFFVRAELADFWRLWLQSSLALPEKHFLLYPNPYPKKRRFQSRWYAHPAFPLALQMQSQNMVVRSNWKAYLEDFATAVALSQQHQSADDNSNPRIKYVSSGGPAEIDPAQPAWTNFEQKYFDVGESCYELVLDKQ